MDGVNFVKVVLNYQMFFSDHVTGVFILFVRKLQVTDWHMQLSLVYQS